MKLNKLFSSFFFLCCCSVANAIELQLPTDNSDTGFFKEFTNMMQMIMNWLAGPYALFVAVLVFISFLVVYFLDPRSTFIQGLLKAGFVIIGIFASFRSILFIYNQF